jgi:hydroxylamine dehydrogenase
MTGLARAAWMVVAISLLWTPGLLAQQNTAISNQTRTCLGCHRSVTPGIVADWQNSRMSVTTPARAMEASKRMRRVSFETLPGHLQDVAVGCAECHTMRSEAHADAFEHAGQTVHTVVSPDDCSVCHPVERKEFSDNLMAEAHGNLMENSLYDALIRAVNGSLTLSENSLTQQNPDAQTNADACLFCHGTRLSVQGTDVRETAMGPMEFPVIRGWPNQGVGRINPDESRGSCAACHPRHRFAIETARKPETCSQCHKGPDVPAYKVYNVSKHGNIYNAQKGGEEWNFSAVPWTVGKDMEAPTCGACHVSLLIDANNQVLAQRTHRMNDRLAWRIFGLPYAHAHPQSADTTIIKSKDGLPLPTALDGFPARNFLISAQEQETRNHTLQQVCLGCHSTGWVQGHFQRLAHTIEKTNAQTRTITQILQKAWDSGAAAGPEAGGSPFDEGIERMWTESWLFYANSIRFASAMSGADYGVFAQGRWHQARTAQQMVELLESKNRQGPLNGRE